MVEKADSCFSVVMNGTIRYKSRKCDDSQNTSSETSNILAGMSSSHNSYFKNDECKSTLKASEAHDFEDLEVTKKEKSLQEKNYQAQFSADPSGQGEEQLGLECHGDNISCITGGIGANISDYGDNLYLDKKDMNSGKVLTNNKNEPSILDAVECSLGSFSSVSSTERKHATLLNVEGSTMNEARSCSSSEKSKIDDVCQEIRTNTDRQISSDNVSESGDLNKALVKDNALLDLEAKNKQGYNLLPLANTEIENSESTLYDVKICDICGDAGREALLAICSSCSDGAEHTYCMREKLDELPGADWQCEECKIKEMEIHNVDKSETVSEVSKPAFLCQSIQNSVSTLIPNKLPNLDDRGLAKGLKSPKILTRSQADHVEETKVSIKSQKIKVKKANMESSEGRSVNGFQAFHYSHNFLSSGSLKGRSQAHSPYCYFSKSVSCNSIINQNVKELVKNDRYKQEIEREAKRSKLKNENVVKSINKSTSFKSSSSGFSNTEPASKDKPFHPSSIENPRGLDEVKERITFEKNPPAISKTSISKSAALASIYHLKTNRRSSQKEENLSSTIESSCQSIAKRSYHANLSGCKERKKRILRSSNSMEFFDEKFNSEDCKELKEFVRSGFSAVDALQPSESDTEDNKLWDSDKFISPRLSSSGGNQTLHFQKCNKTGQEIQPCSSDELQVSAYHPSDERSLSETKKGKDCIDLVDERNTNKKSLSETSPGEASALASRGSFNVLRSDRCGQLFDGIQAHLSTSASRKVLEIINVFPNKIQLEEVYQTSLWPLQFQGIVPDEKNIALFFFPKDNESYEKVYSILLIEMLETDLALKGMVDETELFIFTSKMLPKHSQRWNMLYYLWGMFIDKRKQYLPTQKIPLFLMDNSSRMTAKPMDVIDNPELQFCTLQWSYKVNIGMGCQDKFFNTGKNTKYGESSHFSDAASRNCNPADECSKSECKKRRNQMTCFSIGGSLGQENLSSNIFSQQQCTQIISSQPAIPEISRIVERNFFPVHIAPSINNKYRNPAHITSSTDNYNSESCAPDLELTLGNKSKIRKPAPLLPLLPPLVPFGSGDGDDLSALLSL
ncbi:uncharacterized protein LOC110036807 isoform X2 [Phalaenopsis equestris]|uniref:uncharacterized protein LOC110036807 isoform X2 n=1 Tax=Phalaenopsis equestris TaxID=78828 RepID=UPI0009E2B5AB|nr:uncharacterized protein LOC110036807 isoform X2 [Phalaenopsis equestris]